MSKIFVAVTPLAGHVNPMLAVAELLSKHGHNVFFKISTVACTRVSMS
jgi:UDP:flavonoid glycosyltransferase YjiC (YdhE family)